MLKYELRKIFTNKGLIVILIFSLVIKLLMTFITISNQDEQFNQYYDEYTRLYYGKTPEQKIEMLDIEQQRLEKIIFPDVDSNDKLIQGRIYLEALNRQGPFKRIAYKVADIKEAVILKDSEPELYGKISVPEIIPDRGWDFFIKISSWDFISMLVLVGLSLVFSSEYESGMYKLLLSTANGHVELFRKKITASIIFTLTMVTFSIAMDLSLASIIGPMEGWTATIRSLDTFYSFLTNISIWQYIIIFYLVKLFVGLCTACIVLYISSISQKSYTALITGFCIFGIVGILTNQFNFGEDFILFGVVNVHSLFSNMKSIGIGNKSINIIYISFILYGGLMFVLLMKSYYNYLGYKKGAAR